MAMAATTRSSIVVHPSAAIAAKGQSKNRTTTDNKEYKMSRKSDAEEIYEIAVNASGPISLAELAEMLGYGSSRAVAKRVSSAYSYYRGEDDMVACETIARTFVNQIGDYAW
jgi:mannose-6-phosphate isomerase class I